jgi:dihydroorotase (multifunctional complex type)
MFDLGVEGGLLVTPAGRFPLNIYVENGRIAALTPDRQPARQRIDSAGLLVMPGMVDTHVHLMDPGQLDREDFPTGTAAAARAGVTTIIEHTHGAPVRTVEDLAAKRDYLADRSRVDFGLAAHAWPDRIDQVEPLWAAGAAFFKVFTCTTHGVPGFDTANLRALLQRVAICDAICLIHSEDEALTASAEQELKASGRVDGGVIPGWRHRDAELVALATTALLARRTGARVVAAHVSSPEGIAVVERERREGARVVVECCPQYFSLLEQEALEFGAFRKFTPPARARTTMDLDDMWMALAQDRVNHISTDHAPSTTEQKLAGSIWDVHFGLPGIDTTLSVLLDAAHRGRVSYERVVQAYSESPAKTYGMFPRKGSLQPGADADIVLVDPGAAWTVRDEDILSRAGWSPFAGRTLVGRAVRTYLRGELVADEGRVVVPAGTGRFLPGPGHARGALS